jgi:hypothetical protein
MRATPLKTPDLILSPSKDEAKISCFFSSLLVLLRHKLDRYVGFLALPQHGHRGRLLAKAAASLRLRVAIEFGKRLSGLSGMSSWPVTFGNCSFFALPCGRSS